MRLEELEKHINICEWMESETTTMKVDGEYDEYYDKKYKIIISWCANGRFDTIYQIRANE